MGRGLGRILAQKGANVVIVARDQRKLDEAMKYISVRDYEDGAISCTTLT